MATAVLLGASSAVGAAAASGKPLDGRKFVTTIVNGAPFVVEERYTGIKYIGGGAYGMVCSAEDSVRARGGA